MMTMIVTGQSKDDDENENHACTNYSGDNDTVDITTMMVFIKMAMMTMVKAMVVEYKTKTMKIMKIPLNNLCTLDIYIKYQIRTLQIAVIQMPMWP